MHVALGALGSSVGLVFIGVGLLLCLGGAIGALRFPDVYTRLHAVLVLTIGAVLVILGLAASAPDWGIAMRLLVLAALVGAFGPVMTQLLANAAHTGGLSPIAGRHAAARPGARKAAADE